MTTPVEEHQNPLEHQRSRQRHNSFAIDDDKTVMEEPQTKPKVKDNVHLNVDTKHSLDMRRINSPSRYREEAHRLDDDLLLLRAERQVSSTDIGEKRDPSRLRARSADESYDIDTTGNREQSKFRPPENPESKAGKFFKKVHDAFWLFRYILYITPLVLVILVPLLLGALLFKEATVGDVKLDWFCIWLEIVWLSLWAGRIISKCLPWPIGVIASLFTNNNKKWRDMGKQLELPATLFFWLLAVEISFLPTMIHHHFDGNQGTRDWEVITNKVIISLFVFTILNLVEKIIIQLIAMRFHLRTYQDRIELNKFQIASLVKLYTYSKEKISASDEDFTEKSGGASGTRTPAQLLRDTQKSTVEAFKKIGDFTGRIAGDFAGKQVASSSHPHQVILTLLSSTDGSQVLARRLYRTFCRDDAENVYLEDLRAAFDDDDEAEAAFTMFDKDMNGDISMEELEAVCVEIGRERKSITASLKDLDSVISRLDGVFLFIVCVIAILVFISLISTSAAGVLTSAGSTVLALSWLFSATAQEFLQSLIFVFVKHPFDVGDRVAIYGNTGSSLKGDDYFVKKISLLYTEFKKMEGHVVQAPNSYLNQLFILNQRRSGGLAEAIPLVVKFGTTLTQITELKERLLEFVRSEKREYQSNILTELREITEAYSLTINVVFFYKSNWQNELLRLQRRNKFICAMMVAMEDLGIEGPRRRIPGASETNPYFVRGMAPEGPTTLVEPPPSEPPFVDPEVPTVHSPSPAPVGESDAHRSVSGRHRGETLSQMGRRMDFSLGISSVVASDPTGDIFEQRESPKLPPVSSPSRLRRRSSATMARSSSVNYGIGGARLERISTDGSAAAERASHRNRFFRRGPWKNDEDAMESGMAEIMEERLDPRSGRVSPTAWRASNDMPRTSLGSMQESSARRNFRGN